MQNLKKGSSEDNLEQGWNTENQPHDDFTWGHKRYLEWYDHWWPVGMARIQVRVVISVFLFSELSAACSKKSVFITVSWQVVLYEPVAVILSQKLRAQVLLDKRKCISPIYLHLKI